jgi:zinc-ribbon domain
MTPCPTCGTKLSETDNFCGECGRKTDRRKTNPIQKYLGLPGYALLILLLLPVAGFFATIVVSSLVSVIFHPNPKLMDDLSSGPTFAITIALGLAVGFYLNRRNIYVVDLFAWLAPAAWFTLYLCMYGPKSVAPFLKRGPACGACAEQFVFPIPLMFCVAYSLAALCQKMRTTSKSSKLGLDSNES